MTIDATETPEVYRIRVPFPLSELTLGQDERGYVGLHLHTDVHRKQAYSLVGAGDVSDAETELLLGKSPRGFHGLVARVGSGSAFLSAGGGVLGLSKFEDFGKSLTGISLGIGGIMAVAGFVEKARYRSENSFLSLTLATISLGAQVTLQGLAIGSHGIPEGAGTVSIYGDTSVSIVAPATVSVTAVGLTSLNSGVSSTVNGMIYAGVSGGIIAGVSGIVSASVSGLATSLTGDDTSTVSARHGEVRLEGKRILVGSPSVLVKGVVRPRSGIVNAQQATDLIRVEADDEVFVAAGKPPALPTAPTKLRATAQGMRLESPGAAVTLTRTARMFAGTSIVELGARAITLARSVMPAKLTHDTAVTAAEGAHTAALAAADAARDTSVAAEHLLIAGVAGGLVGAITAGAALGGTRTSDAGTVVGGILGGGVAGGAAVGTLATLATVKLVKRLAANKARELAVKGADLARKTALDVAARLEDTVLTSATIMPATPKIQIKDDRIVLSVGLNKVTIDALGVTVSAPAGQVKVQALTTQVSGVVNQLG
ncbi:MAG: hypothetical protein FJ095_01930 [Deltaproteobacteria bacterium]|nr:hypothetical protein [Deltaproteobacteria bacterium]